MEAREKWPVKSLPLDDTIVGSVLCHDMTRIIPGIEKGPAFRKGHVIKPEDIPVLLDMGKENIYVYSPKPGILHEDEAALELAAFFGGPDIQLTQPREGRINLVARKTGVLDINREQLFKINSCGGIAFATLRSGTPVSEGEAVAGTRIIPLFMAAEKIRELQKAVPEPVIRILPYQISKIAIISTGSEVFKGRIKDSFWPVIAKKIYEYNCELIKHTVTDDSPANIAREIKRNFTQNAEMIICTGGMSVDPDDRTPEAISMACDEIVSYGAPVFPGAMFMLGYIKKDDQKVPVLGLPGCVMHHKGTIFDLLLPRILSGQEISSEDIAGMGHGGFCKSCDNCFFPHCSFGKGCF